MVEILPFRGARVRRPSLEELLEAYAVRAELESLGVRLAMPTITDEDIADLDEMMAGMEAAASAGDRHETAVRDAAFHEHLLGLAGNAILSRVWASLEPFSRTYITLIGPNTDAAWTAGLHRPILAAIHARDVVAVERELRLHFDLASAKLSDTWKEPAARS